MTVRVSVAFASILSICVSAASGATLTWSGGESGAFSDTTWTIGGEPAGRAPAAGDRLVIPSGKTVTASGSDASTVVALDGIDLDGVFVCSGFSSSLTTFPVTFSLSGAGDFRAYSCGHTAGIGIGIRSDNSAYSGTFYFSNTWVNVRNKNALGGANGGDVTFLRDQAAGYSGGLDFYAAGDYPNNIYHDNFAQYAGIAACCPGVTNSGVITAASCKNAGCTRLCGNGTNPITFTGNIVRDSLLPVEIDLNNVRIVGDGEFFSGPSKRVFADAGTSYIGATLSRDCSYFQAGAGGIGNFVRIKFEKKNVINGVEVRLHSNVRLDMNGYDQTFTDISLAAGTSNRYISASSPSTMTVVGKSLASKGILPAALEDHLSFVLDSPGNTLTITNEASNPSTTDGALIVSNGTLVLNESVKMPSLSKLSVAGGTLSILAGAQVNESAWLEISAGTLSLGAVGSGDTLTVDRAVVGTTYVPAGTYTLASPGPFEGHIEGGGSVKVTRSFGPLPTPVEFVWTGGSGTSLSTPANWVGGEAPDLEGGCAVLKFGAPAAAQVDGEICVYGIVYDGTANFTLAAGANAKLRVGCGGICVTNSTSSAGVTFTVNPPIEFTAFGDGLSSSADSKLVLAGDLTAFPEVNSVDSRVAVRGLGTLDLSGNNAALLPAFEIMNRIKVDIRSPTALGSPSRAIITRKGALPNAYAPLTNDVPIDVYESFYDPQWVRVMNPNRTWFVQNGKITFKSAVNSYISNHNGITAGGIESPGAKIWLGVDNTENHKPHIIGPGAIKTPYNVLFDDGGHYDISAIGNEWSYAIVNASYTSCLGDDVLCSTGGLVFGTDTSSSRGWYPGGTRCIGILDLKGHSQTVTYISTRGSKAAGDAPHQFGVVTSTVPATLSVAGSELCNDVRVRFAGAVSLEYCGTGRLSLSNEISRTAGTLSVQSGEVRIDAGAGWSGSGAKVEIGGAGLLTIAAAGAPTAFGGDRSAVNLSIGESGKIDVLDGATVTVGRLCLNGEYVPGGTYSGANGSGDKTYASAFGTGTGSLHVLNRCGIFILIR